MITLALGLPAGSELIILAVVALILFGGTKIAGFGKNTGRAIREFREEAQIQSKKDKDAAATDVAKPSTEVHEAELVDPERKTDN